MDFCTLPAKYAILPYHGMKRDQRTQISTDGDAAMPGKVIKHEMQETFRSCPTCGYRDGFHSSFMKEEGETKWLFICPSCHDMFDIGLTVDHKMEPNKA